jgi:hypothetical protein
MHRHQDPSLRSGCKPVQASQNQGTEGVNGFGALAGLKRRKMNAKSGRCDLYPDQVLEEKVPF